MKMLQPFIFHEVEEMATELEKAAARNDEFGDLAGRFIQRIAMIRKVGSVPGVGNASFFVVIAEKKDSHLLNRPPWHTALRRYG